MNDRPNLLCIFTDQQAAAAMSCAGNRDVHTPNIDRLAERGTRFTNAYCAFPLCGPSRVSMVTGKLPSQLGIRGNEDQPPDEVWPRSIGRVLEAGGYRCAWGGKWHAGGGANVPDRDQCDHGFERICGFDDNALPGACAEFFGRDHDRPWLLVASFDNPHNICQHGRDQPLPRGEVADAPPADYPNLPTNFREPPFEPQPLRLYRRNSPKTQMQPAYSPQRWRRYRHFYCRIIEKVDAQIGQVLDALDANRLADDTVVIFSSDHGEMAGAHESSHKSVLYAESVRVPLIVFDPSLDAASHAGNTCDALVNNGPDLLPTLCDYAGAAAPDDLRGRSIRPLLSADAAGDWPDELVVETQIGLPGGAPSGTSSYDAAGRLLRTATHTYMCYEWGQYREQLFDVDADPGEQVNLAVESRHAATLQQHRDRLRSHCEAIGDDFSRMIPR